MHHPEGSNPQVYKIFSERNDKVVMRHLKSNGDKNELQVLRSYDFAICPLAQLLI